MKNFFRPIKKGLYAARMTGRIVKGVRIDSPSRAGQRAASLDVGVLFPVPQGGGEDEKLGNSLMRFQELPGLHRCWPTAYNISHVTDGEGICLCVELLSHRVSVFDS
jgi:hypothetical protein